MSEGSLDVVIDDYSFFHSFRVDSFKKRGAAKILPRNSQITVLVEDRSFKVCRKIRTKECE